MNSIIIIIIIINLTQIFEDFLRCIILMTLGVSILIYIIIFWYRIRSTNLLFKKKT